MIASRLHFGRYWEGANASAACIVLIMITLSLVFYTKVVLIISPWTIDTDILLSYTLNIFSIALGSLISLFALLASRPTDFLIRVRATTMFQRLIGNIKITMMFLVLSIAFNFLFGVLKISPHTSIDVWTSIFVFWIGLSVATLCFLFTTVRLIFLALT